MAWFKRKEPPPPPPEGDEWITVPFRFVEAARISIYTIGSRPEVPDVVRWWIAQWLVVYNQQLVTYMQQNYGPDIFAALDRITHEVTPAGDEDPPEREAEPEWHLWENQFEEDK